MRRILEQYFDLFWGHPIDRLLERMRAENRFVCMSLVHSCHGESHAPGEHIEMPSQEMSSERMREVFKKIYVKSKQGTTTA